MSYSEDIAIVYYSTGGVFRRGIEELITFEKQDEEWVWTEWNTIWSSTGSADSFIWPFIR